MIESINADDDAIKIIGVTDGNREHGLFMPFGATFKNPNGGLKIQADEMFDSSWSSSYDNKFRFDIAGPIVLESNSASFTNNEEIGRKDYHLNFVSTPETFQYGKVTNRKLADLGEAPITAQRVIEIYAESIEPFNSSLPTNFLTVNQSDGHILLRANYNITLPDAKAIRSAGSPVILWADGNSSGYGIVNIGSDIDTTFSSSAGAPIFIGGGAGETY